MNTATLSNTGALPAGAVPLKQDATIIGLVGLAHASSHFAHLLLPLLFPVFMKEFGLSFSQLGLLMTIFFVV
ncbi:MAG: MFS transporter, partial [Pseudomonadota bacterium]